MEKNKQSCSFTLEFSKDKPDKVKLSVSGDDTCRKAFMEQKEVFEKKAKEDGIELDVETR